MDFKIYGQKIPSPESSNKLSNFVNLSEIHKFKWYKVPKVVYKDSNYRFIGYLIIEFNLVSFRKSSQEVLL